jgi:hypothetical protein
VLLVVERERVRERVVEQLQREQRLALRRVQVVVVQGVLLLPLLKLVRVLVLEREQRLLMEQRLVHLQVVEQVVVLMLHLLMRVLLEL